MRHWTDTLVDVSDDSYETSDCILKKSIIQIQRSFNLQLFDNLYILGFMPISLIHVESIAYSSPCFISRPCIIFHSIEKYISL